MADVETTKKAAAIIKDACPLRTVLRDGKPSPYFGASGTCRDCSYDWLTQVADVLKVVKARRAAYEKQVEKFNELKIQMASVSFDAERFRRLKEAFGTIQVLCQEEDTQETTDDDE